MPLPTPHAQPALPELIYVFDPLCGYCYPFTPHVARLQSEFADRVSVTLLLGGLFKGERAPTLAAMRAHILDHSRRISQANGVAFGERFYNRLNDPVGLYDSVPPSLAFVAFRSLAPHLAMAVAEDLHTAVFFEGADTNNPATYEALAAKRGLDARRFREVYDAAATRAEMQADFVRAKRLGVVSFPTLLSSTSRGTQPLVAGSGPYAPMKSRLDALLQSLADGQPKTSLSGETHSHMETGHD